MSGLDRTPLSGRTLAGAVVLASAVSAPLHAQLPALERVQRIGCASCEGITLFYSIADLALGGDNQLYVLDQAPPYVRVFRTDGSAVTSFGRQGRGPGEFHTPSALGLIEGGGLEIVDVMTRRSTIVDADGAETGTRPFRMFPIAASRAGTVGPTYAAVTDFRSPTLAIEVWTADAEPRELIRFGTDFPRGKDGEPSLYVALAASPSGRFAVADGSTEYRIAVFDREGRKLHDLVRDVARVKQTEEELAAEEERRKRAQARANALRQVESRRPAPPRMLPPAPERRAHFLSTALHYDPAGRLWVRTERGGSAETIFDIFDGGGLWLGEVRVGERIGRYALGRDLLAGVTFDDDEAQYVSVYRVTW